MKKIFYLIIGLLLIPSVVFASATYEKGVDIANKYIYDYPDYSRYIKLTGDLPYWINSSNKATVHTGFKTGGFLNEREYIITANGATSWLAPGIEYWIANPSSDYRVLNVKVEPSSASATSGVRVTEFVRTEVKIKGAGTKTNPWVFSDGYVVKVGSSDQSLGTVVGGCEHVQEGGSCVFNLTYDSNQGVDVSNCKTTVESKGATFSQSGKTVTISNVHSDISCFIDFGTNNKCYQVSFANAGGSGGMTKSLYYRYGYGWFDDSLCLKKATGLTVPTKTGNRFNGYKYIDLTIIDENSKIVAGVKEDIKNNITATASWTPCGAGKYLYNNRCVNCPKNTYSTGSANASCTNCPTGYTTAGEGSSIKSACRITCQADKLVKTADAQCANCDAGYNHDEHTVNAGSTSTVCVGNTYYVHYNGNGNSGGSMTNSTHTYGTSSTLSAVAFTKTGHQFDGWATSSTGSVAYANQASVSTLTTTKNGTFNLYAKWTACGAGKYLKDGVCTNCPKGWYSTGSANASCTQCPTGYDTDGEGSSAKSACKISCPANMRVNSADAQCTTSCDTGYHHDAHTVNAGSTSSDCSINHINIQFHKNGGSWGSTTSTDVHMNSGEDLVRFYSSNQNYRSWNYGSAIDLPNYNNSGYINIKKSGYHGKGSSEWCTGTSGNGNCYNQATEYANAGTDTTANKFCDARYGDCTVTLYVNWEKNSSGGGSGGGGSSGGGGGNCCDYGTCCCGTWCQCHGGCSGPSNCFFAGTKVYTKNGYKDIDKIEIGEYVLTFNEETKQNEYKRVLGTSVRTNVVEEIYTLKINGDVINVTEGHHFYIKSKDGKEEWKAVRYLEAGDMVRFADGTFHKVDELTHKLNPNKVYNLTVEDNHNYYVGENMILVHNLLC